MGRIVVDAFNNRKNNWKSVKREVLNYDHLWSSPILYLMHTLWKYYVLEKKLVLNNILSSTLCIPLCTYIATSPFILHMCNYLVS